jgi:hypothetical protein
VRKNYDALTGNSPGAQRRQESAKKRFEELYQKFDENTPEALIRLYFEEVFLSYILSHSSVLLIIWVLKSARFTK